MATAGYVDQKELYSAIKVEKEKFQVAEDAGKSVPELSRYIAESIISICEGLSFRSNYRNYTYREDMVSSAIMNCFRYWRNFDCDRYDNPHAYFSFVASKAFHRYIKLEKKAQYVKYLSVEEMVIDLDLNQEDDTTYKKFLETYLTDQWKVKKSFESDLTHKKNRAKEKANRVKEPVDADIETKSEKTDLRD